jgi:hypothetical protein
MSPDVEQAKKILKSIEEAQASSILGDVGVDEFRFENSEEDDENFVAEVASEVAPSQILDLDDGLFQSCK